MTPVYLATMHRSMLPLITAAIGVFTSLTAAIDLVPRVRLVEVIQIFFGAFAAGAGLTAALVEFKKARAQSRRTAGPVLSRRGVLGERCGADRADGGAAGSRCLRRANDADLLGSRCIAQRRQRRSRRRRERVRRPKAWRAGRGGCADPVWDRVEYQGGHGRGARASRRGRQARMGRAGHPLPAVVPDVGSVCDA